MRSNDFEELKKKIELGERIFLYRNNTYIGLLRVKDDDNLNINLDANVIKGGVVIEIMYANPSISIIFNADEWE